MAKNDSILDISTILNEYSEEIQEDISKTAEDKSKEARQKLREVSPKRTGEYRKGWKVKVIRGRDFIDCIVHNATKYQLTHLLEKPHAKRNGGVTTPKVHIKPVEEKIVREYEKEIENIIKNGG